MERFKNEQQLPLDNSVERIDSLATELEIRRMRIYEESFNAAQDRKDEIAAEMKILEDNLALLKRAKKIPDIHKVRAALNNKISKLYAEVVEPWGQEGRDADRIDARKKGILSTDDLRNSVKDLDKRGAR